MNESQARWAPSQTVHKLCNSKHQIVYDSLAHPKLSPLHGIDRVYSTKLDNSPPSKAWLGQQVLWHSWSFVPDQCLIHHLFKNLQQAQLFNIVRAEYLIDCETRLLANISILASSKQPTPPDLLVFWWASVSWTSSSHTCHESPEVLICVSAVVTHSVKTCKWIDIALFDKSSLEQGTVQHKCLPSRPNPCLPYCVRRRYRALFEPASKDRQGNPPRQLQGLLPKLVGQMLQFLLADKSSGAAPYSILLRHQELTFRRIVHKLLTAKQVLSISMVSRSRKVAVKYTKWFLTKSPAESNSSTSQTSFLTINSLSRLLTWLSNGLNVVACSLLTFYELQCKIGSAR